MRFVPIFCLAMCCASPTHAAPPTKSPVTTSVSINIRKASDLAEACTLAPTSKTSFAQLNFCNGFAQGVLQANEQNQNGTKVCIPSPSPKRSATMKEFANWVRADATRKDDWQAWHSFDSWEDGFPARRVAQVISSAAQIVVRPARTHNSLLMTEHQSVVGLSSVFGQIRSFLSLAPRHR